MTSTYIIFDGGENRKSWPNRSRRHLFRPGWKVLLHKTCWSNGKVEWLCILQSIQSTNWNLGQRQSVLKNDDQRLLVLLVSVTAKCHVVSTWWWTLEMADIRIEVPREALNMITGHDLTKLNSFTNSKPLSDWIDETGNGWETNWVPD